MPNANPSTEIVHLVWNRGIDSNPNDAYEFTESLLFLAKNQEERKKLGESGRF